MTEKAHGIVVMEPLAVDVKIASQMVGLSVSTLNNRRGTGKDSPPFYYEGAAVLYPVAGLKAYVASRPTFTSITAAELYDQMQKQPKP